MNRLLKRMLLAMAVLVAAWPAMAHEISMPEMPLREVSREQCLWQWTTGNRTGDGALRPRWPAGCQDGGDGTLACAPAGLSGKLAMEGVGQAFSAVILKINWLDGQSSVHTLTQAQPEVQLFGAVDDQRGFSAIAWAYGAALAGCVVVAEHSPQLRLSLLCEIALRQGSVGEAR